MECAEIKQSALNHERVRIVNFRGFLIAAAFVVVTIFIALITVNNALIGGILFAGVFALATFLFLRARGCYKKGQSEGHVFIAFAICMVLIVASYFSFIGIERNWTSEYPGGSYYASGASVTVTGMVESDIYLDGQRLVYLNNVSLNGSRISGKILIYADIGSTFDELVSGMVIQMNARLNPVRLVNKFKVNGWAFRKNIRYTISTNKPLKDCVINYTDPGVVINISEFIRDKLFYALGADYGALGFGMITGKSDYIDDDTSDHFSVSGIIHILAVSGLHLNILAGALMWVLKRLRVRRSIIALTVFLFLVLYAFLAGFSPSVLRALIMSTVVLFVYLFGAWHDLLSSLCLAFCLVLAFAPVFMFEAGFIYSFSAVFGIALFYDSFLNALTKLRIPKFIAAPPALSLSVQIGILPAQAFMFNNYSLYGMFVNMFLMPLMTIIFMALFLGLLIACITPWTFPLTIAGIGIGMIDAVAVIVSKLPFARIVIFATPLIFCCYPIYFVMSRFVMLRQKFFKCITCLLACVMLFAVQNPCFVRTDSLVPIDSEYRTMTLVRTEQGNYLVGDFLYITTLEEYLTDLRIHKLDGLFVNSINEYNARQIQRLWRQYRGFALYFPLQNYSGGVEYLDGITLCDFEEEGALSNGFSSVYNGSHFFGYSFEGLFDDSESAPKMRVLFVPYGKDYSKFDRLKNYSVIRASDYYYTSGLGNMVYLLPDVYYRGGRVVRRQARYLYDYKNGVTYLVRW